MVFKIISNDEKACKITLRYKLNLFLKIIQNYLYLFSCTLCNITINNIE